jgi:DNA mismatch repair protein MutS
VRTEQKNGKVQFLYELIEAGATQSFGIHVAELAGLPREVLKRSREILKELEDKEAASAVLVNTQLDFFRPKNAKDNEEDVPSYLLDIEKSLKDLDVLNLTPLQALQKLHDLKSQLVRH